MKSVADKDDFVAFKLDIDHPDTQNPIDMDLLNVVATTGLVDEFFFELHFQCEVMTQCGWGEAIPTELHGLKLKRPDVMKYFLKLRQRGIRAHIWP